MYIWYVLGPVLLIVTHIVYKKKMQALAVEAKKASNAYFEAARTHCVDMRYLASSATSKEEWIKYRTMIIPNIEQVKSRYEENLFNPEHRAIIKRCLIELETAMMINESYFKLN